MGPELLEAFLDEAPASVGVHLILDRLLEPNRIDELFRNQATRQYQQQLLFSQLVDLTIDVVLGEQPSLHASYLKHKPKLSVSAKSVYNKINSMELDITAALVADSARQAQSLMESFGNADPSWLEGYRVRLLDGNQLSATEHRIEELRTVWDAPLPGKVLVVLEQTTRLVEQVFLTPDGHAQERSLLTPVLGVIQPKDLWLADRNFCTHGFLCGLAQRGAFFAIRRHGTVQGAHRGKWSKPVTTDRGTVCEQDFWIEHDGVCTRFRCVRVELKEPTKDGETVIEILTNLPPDVPAEVVAELYRKRWTIEGLFHDLAQTMECEPTALGHPRAFLFTFCLGLVASNAVQVLKAAMRRIHGVEVWATLSLYYLMLEVAQSSRGMRVMTKMEWWRAYRDLGLVEWRDLLVSVIRRIDPKRYKKAPPRKRKPPPKRGKYTNGGHVSTHKLLEKRKKTKGKGK